MRAVDGVIAALAAHGGPTSSWLVGEPSAAPPEALAQALARAARTDRYSYAPPAGLPRLREVLASLHHGPGSEVAPAQIVVTNGAKAGLLALFATLLEPGDELIHPRPCYPAYPAMANRLGARPIEAAEPDGCFDGWTQAVSERISPRTRAVVLASPSNPTGATLSSSQARDLVELCRRHGLRLICDEAYTDYRFSADSRSLPADFDPARETVVQVRSASKSWALCGWRVGWVVADAGLAARVAGTHTSLVNPAPGPAQTALCSLSEVAPDYLEQARRDVQTRLTEICSALADAGLDVRHPDGGFYLWFEVASRVESAALPTITEWCIDLARRHGVGLWPGDDFGGPGRVRLAATAHPADTWRRALNQLAASLPG
jgi:aspartate/methionine/tyrosine aminotransferase